MVDTAPVTGLDNPPRSHDKCAYAKHERPRHQRARRSAAAAGWRTLLAHHRWQGRHGRPGPRCRRRARGRLRAQARGTYWRLRNGALGLGRARGSFRRSGHGRFGPPWPAVAIATGRASIPYIRALKRKAGFSTYTVVLQDPKSGPSIADLIWVPAHDKRRGANVITTPTAPHSFSARPPGRAAGSHAAGHRGACPAPASRVILGGKNAVYKFTESDDARLRGVDPIPRGPWGQLHDHTVAAHPSAADRGGGDGDAGSPRVLWDGKGENPYATFLAHADALIVTADSVNMTGEASASGKPVLCLRAFGRLG